MANDREEPLDLGTNIWFIDKNFHLNHRNIVDNLFTPCFSSYYSGDYQKIFAEFESSEDEKEEIAANKRKSAANPSKQKRTKDCPGCGAVLAISVRECRLCDYQFTSKSMLQSSQSAQQESLQIREKFPFEPERVSLSNFRSFI